MLLLNSLLIHSLHFGSSSLVVAAFSSSSELKGSSASTMSDLQTPLQSRPKRKKTWVDYFVSFRWIIVILLVLPISFTIYFLTYLGDVRSEMKSYKQRQKEHDENVKKVVKRLKQRNPAKDGLVCTARKPWIAVGMRNVDYKRARHFEVDLTAFRNILEIFRILRKHILILLYPGMVIKIILRKFQTSWKQLSILQQKVCA